MRMGMLIDYEYCVGCSACEMACMNLPNHGPDTAGIRLIKMGPWLAPNNDWQYDYLPFPTDWCDMCTKVTNNHEHKPPCVRHCNYGALKIGVYSEMAELGALKRKMMLFSLPQAQ